MHTGYEKIGKFHGNLYPCRDLITKYISVPYEYFEKQRIQKLHT